jgi:hypothetical protein
VTLTKMRIGDRTSVIRDITGQRFGTLTARAPMRSANRKIIWSCDCDCGKTRTVRSLELLRGKVRYCHACRPRSPLKAMRDEREACALLAEQAATGAEAAALIRARCAP